MVRRAVDVHDHARARLRLRLRRVARVPDVLADVHAHVNPGHPVDFARSVRLEIARLVEDAVVRQPLLVVNVRQPPVMDHGGGVVNRDAALVGRADRPPNHTPRLFAPIDETNNCRDPPAGFCHPLERRDVVGDEARTQEQVLRRIARDRQLRERNDIHAQLPRPLDILECLPHIPLEIADRRIDLREPDPERLRHAT